MNKLLGTMDNTDLLFDKEKGVDMIQEIRTLNRQDTKLIKKNSSALLTDSKDPYQKEVHEDILQARLESSEHINRPKS